MNDENNIKLLMEETGCERHEAEFALSLANNNIEKAIVKLGIIQKYIIVFKIKLLFPNESFYGLVHIAINTKIYEILRFSVVFSHKPQTYEISAEIDWFSFEKAIFSARLETEAMEAYTKRLEEPLRRYIQRMLKEKSKLPDEEMIRAFFNPLNVKIEIIKEQINMTNYKKLPNFDTKNNRNQPQKQDSFIQLKVKILEDPNGKPVEDIEKGDNVLTLITDERDIALYLANLIGGQRKGEMIPISAVVSNIVKENDEFVLSVQYSAAIISFIRIKEGARLSVVDDKDDM
jgi:hypothetical protein